MTMEIRIVESLRKYNQELAAKLKKGMKKPETGIVMTAETFSKVFSPERIKLLQKIYRNNIKSIYQLAREMDKPYEVVFRNIRYLEGIGLLKIKEDNRRRIPHLVGKLSIQMFEA